MLVSLATEYNDALLVVENANVGWAVIQQIIDRGYPNLYYSPKSDQLTAEDFIRAIDNSSNSVPGFTMSLRTRPLVINKFREFITDRSVIIRSKRLLAEMKVFLWVNGRPEAQSGYNDDLIMPFAIGQYLRDTALRFGRNNLDLVKATLNGINKSSIPYTGVYNSNSSNQRYNNNPYKIKNPYGNDEDISWLVRK
jgi:hypothetical protein